MNQPFPTYPSVTPLRVFAALGLVLALMVGLFGARAGYGQTAPLQDAPFGPFLFLIDAPDSQWPTYLPPTTVLHARVDEESGARFIASGSPDDLTALQAAGAPVLVLDPATADHVYYLVDTQADPAITPALPAGALLWSGDQTLLVVTTTAQELALVEGITQQGVAVSLLSSAPLAPPTADDMLDTSVSAAALAPDPAVAALLPALTEGDLSILVNQLSGQTSVTVGGLPVTLNTRYTFTARVHDAERFVYDTYAALGIPVSYANWTNGAYSGRNVVAEVRGTVNPEKVLLVGGHLDSNSNLPYANAPGADDNATGTAVTLLLARILKAYPPAITVRFVHFTGEEQGQWGSKVYARTLRANSEQVVGLINLDMIGWDSNGDRVVEIHTGTGPKSKALGTAFLERNTRYALGLTFEQKMVSASRFSDHSPFWDNDYAAFLVIENFFDDTIVRDRNPYYHNVGDLALRVNYNYVARIGRVALATVAELGGYNLSGATPPAPTPIPTATPLPTPTPDPGACTNLLVNGDFETTGGWQFGSTPFPARYVTSPVYSGLRAAGLGIPAASANRLAYSSVYQKITIPANAASPVVLRFMRQSSGPADGLDYREALLLDSAYHYVATLERSYVVGDGQWVERSYNVTAYRGRTLVLYFNVYNNGKATQMWAYVDRISLGPCANAAAAQSPAGEPLPEPAVDPVVGAWNLYLPGIIR